MTPYPGHQQRARALHVSASFSGLGGKTTFSASAAQSDRLVYMVWKFMKQTPLKISHSQWQWHKVREWVFSVSTKGLIVWLIKAKLLSVSLVTLEVREQRNYSLILSQGWKLILNRCCNHKPLWICIMWQCQVVGDWLIYLVKRLYDKQWPVVI